VELAVREDAIAKKIVGDVLGVLRGNVNKPLLPRQVAALAKVEKDDAVVALDYLASRGQAALANNGRSNRWVVTPEGAVDRPNAS
jgi:hypothetical protein